MRSGARPGVVAGESLRVTHVQVKLPPFNWEHAVLDRSRRGDRGLSCARRSSANPRQRRVAWVPAWGSKGTHGAILGPCPPPTRDHRRPRFPAGFTQRRDSVFMFIQLCS